MIVTYSPAGQDRQEWDFDPNQIKASRAEVIENRFGDTFGEWQVGVLKGSMRARRVLLWHLLSADHPSLRLDDVDPAAGEIGVAFTRSELEAMRAAAETATTITAAEREQAIAALDSMIADAPQGGPGKAS
jgi:hypothetical protein